MSLGIFTSVPCQYNIINRLRCERLYDIIVQRIHQIESIQPRKMSYKGKKPAIGFKRHEEASDRSENMRNRKFIKFRISYVSPKNFQIDLNFFSITLKKKSENFQNFQKNHCFFSFARYAKFWIFLKIFRFFFKMIDFFFSDRFGNFFGIHRRCGNS